MAELRAVVVDLAGAEYHRLVVSTPDAEGVASRLRAATEASPGPG